MNRMNRTRLLRRLAGCLLAGLLVAACADSGGDGGAGQGGATTVPATAPTTAPGGRTEPTRTGGPVTVTGTVTKLTTP